MRIASIVSVVDARVSTAASAHHESTGIWAPSMQIAHPLHRRHLLLDAGKALNQRDIAERVGGALGHVGIVGLDRGLQLLSSVQDQAINPAKTTQSRISNSANRQLMKSVSGSSTMSETKLEKFSRKKASHRLHSVFVPVIITFISRPE